MRESSRKALTEAAAERSKELPPAELVSWQELCEDASTDFQRACLEAALLAAHPQAALHAFADAIRDWTDGTLAEACRPLPGDSDQDPLRAFRLNGHSLSPRGPAPASPSPRPASEPPVRLLDLTGGVGPPRYGNVLDMQDAGARGPSSLGVRELGYRSGGASPASGASGATDDPFSAAGSAFGIRFTEQRVDAPATLARRLNEAGLALEAGIPVPVFLGRAPGDLRRYALLLQVHGEGPRRAFQLHDPFGNETVWVNHRDLAAARELPLSDRSLRCLTALLLPRG